MPNFFFGSNVFEKMLNLTMCWNFVAFFILNNKQTERNPVPEHTSRVKKKFSVFSFNLPKNRLFGSAVAAPPVEHNHPSAAPARGSASASR